MSETLQNLLKRSLELISWLNKVAVYKINIQIPLTFQYLSYKQSEIEIKIQITTNSIKNGKYLQTNLTKYVQDLCTGNCKTFLRKTKEDMNKWRDIPCSWSARFNIKMSLPHIDL